MDVFPPLRGFIMGLKFLTVVFRNSLRVETDNILFQDRYLNFITNCYERDK